MKLSLRIERLVLEGVDEWEVERARLAIEEAVAHRLRMTPGLFAEQIASGRLHLPGGRFRIDRGASPEAIGEHVAEQLLAGTGQLDAGGEGGED